MVLRRFDPSTRPHKRRGRRAPHAPERTSPLLLAAIGAAIGAVVVIALSGRLRRRAEYREHGDERGTKRTAGPDRMNPSAAQRIARGAAAPVRPAEPVHAEGIEDRVLEVFLNDPRLHRRPIDIGADSRGAVELAGRVQTTDEARYAVTLARGVPGVSRVIDGLVVRPRV